MSRLLKVAVQMDPIETVNIDGDSTFALMLEAQRRGHALWHYEVRHMSLHEGTVGTGRPADGAAAGPRAAGDGAARARATTTGSARRRRSTWAPWTPC